MKHPLGEEIAWSQYHESLKEHEQFIKNYKFFLDRICGHLDWIKSGNAWTTDDIRSVINAEIKKSHSMDAPNEPCYYRANND